MGVMTCQNGHPIIPCRCGGGACPGYVHLTSGDSRAGHYCRESPRSGPWVKIQRAP